ncbi:MAG: hypothetical protein FJ090_14275 [Deltaproteobacteria bacterium]|nr:hypothetical protein [Deltaproteobacteria bacterium]
MILALSLALVCSLPVASAADFSSPEEVLASFKNEPSIGEVHAMALEYSKTDSRYVDAWLKASKAAAALPRIELAYGYKNGFDTDYGYYTPEEISDDVAEDGEVLTEDDASSQAYGPFETAQAVDIDHAAIVKARWELNKLVMSSDQIRMISEAQDIVKLRDKVLEDVTRLYFERRRLQVDLLLNSGGEMKKRVSDQLRLAELTAQLDAFTGGRFSRALPNK